MSALDQLRVFNKQAMPWRAASAAPMSCSVASRRATTTRLMPDAAAGGRFASDAR